MLRFSHDYCGTDNDLSLHLMRQARDHARNSEYDKAITVTREALNLVTDEKDKTFILNDLACNLIDYAIQLIDTDTPQKDFEKAESIIKEGLEIFIQNKEDSKRYIEGVDVYEGELRESLIAFFMEYVKDLFQKSNDLFELGNSEESLVFYRRGLSKIQEALDVVVGDINVKIQEAIIGCLSLCFFDLKHMNDLTSIANLCKCALTKPLKDEYKKKLGNKVSANIFNCMLALLHKESLNEDIPDIPVESNLSDENLKTWEKVSIDPEPYSVRAKAISILTEAYDMAITPSIKKDLADNILGILCGLSNDLNKIICKDISKNINGIIKIVNEQKWSEETKDNLARIFINSGCVFYQDNSFKDASNFFRYALIFIKNQKSKSDAQINLIKSLGCLANQFMEKAFTDLQDESLVKRNQYIPEAANALKQALNVKTINQTEGDDLKCEVKKSAQSLAANWAVLIYNTQDLDQIEKVQKFVTEVLPTEMFNEKFCKHVYDPLVSLSHEFFNAQDYNKVNKVVDLILKIPVNEKVYLEKTVYSVKFFLEGGNILCKNNEFSKGINLLLTSLKMLQSVSEDNVNIVRLKGACVKDIASWWYKSLTEYQAKPDDLHEVVSLYHKAIMIGGKEIKEQFQLQRTELAVEPNFSQDPELNDLMKTLEGAELSGEDNADGGAAST